MASPFGEQFDPTVRDQGGNYKTTPDGTYSVSGILSFISVEKDSEPPIPVFKVQKDKLVAQFRFRLATSVDGDDTGPAMTATRQELLLLCRAFGGDIDSLPQEDSSRFLMMVQANINNAGKTQIATVKGGKGWVNARDISGMSPDRGIYTWRFGGARNTGSDPTPLKFTERTRTTPNGARTDTDVIFDFEIVGDMYGQPTLFNGMSIPVWVRNPFDGVLEAGGRKLPNFRVGSKGGLLVDVARFRNFVSVFCDADAEHVWQDDIEKSNYGVDELSNPLPVVLGWLNNNLAVGPLDYNDRGYPVLDLESLFIAKGAPVAQASVSSQPTELYELVQALEKWAAPTNIFLPTPKNSADIVTEFTEDGKDWAKAQLGPLCEAEGLPRAIAPLTPEQMRQLTVAVKAKMVNIPDQPEF